MADSKPVTVSMGVSFSSLLGIVFITLKLCGVIRWSWWWVTAPFWLVPAIALAVLLICVVGLGVIGLCEK